MAVAFLNAGSVGDVGSAGATSITFSFTPNSGADCLIGGVSIDTGGPHTPTATFNAVGMTTIITETGQQECALFGINGNTGGWTAGAAANFVVSWTGANATCSGICAFSGADQATGTSSWADALSADAATGTSGSVNVANMTADDIGVSAVSLNSNTTATAATGTRRVNQNNTVTSGDTYLGMSTVPGIGTVAASWTWTTTNRNAISVCRVVTAGAAGTATLRPWRMALVGVN